MSAAERSGSFFLDTNVFVYSFDRDDTAKRSVSHGLISEALCTQRGVISTQVVQEFLSVALRKFKHPLTVSECREYLGSVLSPLCRQVPSPGFYDRALLLQEEIGFSFYDTLIVAAAVESGCSVLYTEDLQHKRTVRGVEIVDPFRSA